MRVATILSIPKNRKNIMKQDKPRENEGGGERDEQIYKLYICLNIIYIHVYNVNK